MLVRLIEWEKENGYKSKYVAERLGLSAAEYSKMKHGKKKVPVEIAQKFQSEFKIQNVLELFKH